MTHKIYLIKHLDTGMGYVGITGDELGKRWYQHLHDKNGALYTALRAEGHRMTMELIEEVETREEALAKEQQYIHALGTAQPAGWNRQVKIAKKPKTWKKQTFRDLKIRCPICRSDDIGIRGFEVLLNDTVNGPQSVSIDFNGVCKNSNKISPFMYGDVIHTNGVRIEFWCWKCHDFTMQDPSWHGEGEPNIPPYFFYELFHSNSNNGTCIRPQFIAYDEDKS
jgi:predicted GIY-YIG superfamily endonuclease